MNIENLLKKAFARLKSRYINFLVITVLGWGIGLLIGLAFGLGVGSVILSWIFAKNAATTGMLALLASLIFIAALIYLSSWVQLAVIDSLIQTKKLPPFETYKKVRGRVKDYVIFIVLTMLFFFGLLPFSLLSLFIVFLLWIVWQSFSSFIFLEKKKNGLQNLWISREMVNQKFWPIVGVALTVFLSTVIVSGLLVSSRNGFVNSVVIQLVISPFIISLHYEIYKTLKAPQEAKTPKIWVGLSVAGFVITVFFSVLFFQAMQKVLPEILKQTAPGSPLYKELMDSSPSETI